jgi:GWxTD domain-containing protein
MRFLLVIFSLALLAFSSCRSKQKYTSRPAKGSSNQEGHNLDVQVVTHHESENRSIVYVKLLNENLLYKRPDSSSFFYAHVRIAYQLMLDGNIRKLVDSSSVEVLDRAGTEHVAIKSLFVNFPVNASFGNNYVLSLTVFDINRRSRYHREDNVYKTSKLSAQNFLVLMNDSVAFRNHFLHDQPLTVRYNDTTVHTLLAECFLKEFGAALPPFTIKESDPLKYKPDSIFTIPAVDGQFHVQLPALGFYHLKVEPAEFVGLPLYVFDESFPGVSSSTEMIDCARYLMTREEYDRCKTATDRKKAIDDFWLNIGGSVERARELIKRYYGRVKEANRSYTSYTQGWKSDRGMIYIIFGKPVNIYKSKKDEIWVYGNEANPATLRFVFNKTDNPFSDNDYIMERSQFYKEPWHSAVDYWRQGHVYFEGKR